MMEILTRRDVGICLSAIAGYIVGKIIAGKFIHK